MKTFWLKDKSWYRSVQFSTNILALDKPVGNGASWATKPLDYRAVIASLSPAHHVYFSEIKISQSGERLAGWHVGVRGGVWGRVVRAAPGPVLPDGRRPRQRDARSCGLRVRRNHARHKEFRRLPQSVGPFYQLLDAFCGWIFFNFYTMCCEVCHVLCWCGVMGSLRDGGVVVSTVVDDIRCQHSEVVSGLHAIPSSW